MDEKSTSDLAIQVQEAYTTHVEKLHDRLTQRVRTLASKARAFTRDNRWYSEDNPYAWVLENNYPAVELGQIVEDGVHIYWVGENGTNEKFITWEEVDNIDYILETRYAEAVARHKAQEKSWKAARKVELLQELQKLSEEE